MTRQESFKRRIRDRMADTGERYGAARRVLLEQADRRAADADTTPGARAWVSAPEHSDAVIREATGRGWDEWCEVIDAWPGRDAGHAAIATSIQEQDGIGGWWAQSVTVGYERITGLRLPHQRADGTFTANKSRTLHVDHDELRALLLSADGRDHLFPGVDTGLRSRPTSRNVRLEIGGGVAEIAIEPLEDGRARIVVAHENLSRPEEVDQAKTFWEAWLDALEDA